MNHLGDTLEALDDVVAAAFGEVLVQGTVLGASDGALLDAVAAAARLQRRVEAMLVELVGEVDARAAAQPTLSGIVASAGCRSANDLLQQVTLTSPQTVSGLLRVTRLVRRPIDLCSGARLPPEPPALRGARLEGAVGVEGMVAVLGPLHDLRCAAGGERMREAEAVLAHAVRGTLTTGGNDSAMPPIGGRDLRNLARDLVAHLDPDGIEPAEERAARKRGVSFGIPHDGIVPLRGNLLPDVAAQLQRIFDSLLTPKLTGPRFLPDDASDQAGDEAVEALRADDRTHTQKQHDALATALSVAARSGELPTIGGAVPTLVVSVRGEDLDRGTGFATIDGPDEIVAINTARKITCGGSIQRVVVGDSGRILQLGVTDRVFNHHQRKAIVLRDGGCVIPGCTVPAAWCEIHHDTEHSRGGPTHTDNGILLCWWHHRSLDTREGWQVRMRDGIPEVRGPSWWDISRTWRTTTKSRLRQRLP